MLNDQQFKIDKYNVRDSKVPIEALYNTYVNKVKAKELRECMRPREVKFQFLDQPLEKSFDRSFTNLKTRMSLLNNDLPNFHIHKKIPSEKIKVELHNDHVNYQKGNGIF